MMHNAQKAKSGLKTFELCEFCGNEKQGMEKAEKFDGVQMYKPLLIDIGKREWVKHADFCLQNPNRKMQLIQWPPGGAFYKEDPEFQNSEKTVKKVRAKKSPKGKTADTIPQAIPVAEKVPIAQVLQPSLTDNSTQTPNSFPDASPHVPNGDKSGSPLPQRRLFKEPQSPLMARESLSLESSPYKSSPYKRIKMSQVDLPQSPFAIHQSLNNITCSSCTRLPSMTSDCDDDLDLFYDKSNGYDGQT